MIADSVVPVDAETISDLLLESAINSLARFAKAQVDQDRVRDAYSLCLEMKKLRRPQVIANLDAERLHCARGHA